jgi:hypothetical protein
VLTRFLNPVLNTEPLVADLQFLPQRQWLFRLIVLFVPEGQSAQGIGRFQTVRATAGADQSDRLLIGLLELFTTALPAPLAGLVALLTIIAQLPAHCHRLSIPCFHLLGSIQVRQYMCQLAGRSQKQVIISCSTGLLINRQKQCQGLGQLSRPTQIPGLLNLY